MIRLLGIAGSLRTGSSSRALLRTIARRLDGTAEVRIAEIGMLPHYNADHDGGSEVAALIEAIGAADGLVFVTPEYNYSVPGVLKNAIDWASRPAYQSVFRGKPCFIVSVSGGALGGVRAQAHLKYILNGMLAEVAPGQEIVVPHANAKVTDGEFTDAATLDFTMEQFAAFAARLAGGAGGVGTG